MDWRHVEVPLRIRLDRLHLVLQAAIGWTNSHLYDPDHEQHAESVEWIGENFDPTAVDAERLASDLAALAKRWSRTPTPRRKRTT